MLTKVNAQEIKQVASHLSEMAMIIPTLHTPAGMSGAEVDDLAKLVAERFNVHPEIVEALILIKQTQI